jgi:hypothetical protein
MRKFVARFNLHCISYSSPVVVNNALSSRLPAQLAIRWMCASSEAWYDKRRRSGIVMQ